MAWLCRIGPVKLWCLLVLRGYITVACCFGSAGLRGSLCVVSLCIGLEAMVAVSGALLVCMFRSGRACLCVPWY